MVIAGIIVLFNLVKRIPYVSILDIYDRIVSANSVFAMILCTILGVLQLLRVGIWGVFIAVATALAGIATAACGQVDSAKYVFCFMLEILERIKPTGKVHPLCAALFSKELSIRYLVGFS